MARRARKTQALAQASALAQALSQARATHKLVPSTASRQPPSLTDFLTASKSAGAPASSLQSRGSFRKIHVSFSCRLYAFVARASKGENKVFVVERGRW